MHPEQVLTELSLRSQAALTVTRPLGESVFCSTAAGGCGAPYEADYR
jgi:hypothetical protein